MLINDLSRILIKKRQDPGNAFCGLEDKFGGAELEHPGADGDTGGVGEGSGDPYGSGGEERVAWEA